MKKAIIILLLVLFTLFLLVNKGTKDNTQIVEKYPWQITPLEHGRSSVFGIVLGETSLREVDSILKGSSEVALFELDKQFSLEAYYKNISLGGLIGSFIFTLDASNEQFNKIKKESVNKEPAENKGQRYNLDKLAIEQVKTLIVKNLIYIPTVQLDEKTIVKRFGKPSMKIKLKTKEVGWHYLYPEKGLDLIFKEEGKEVLQYVLPKDFNLLLEPLQTH